ncbi:FMN-dependent NADH-azoreductase [Synechococcales cyanobacterium C]|uniref:FMN dependent NADH:quinone oxidoreductase n=1 Tax=Petrachloros mirabilis ULC683 TaxID=2781853 RepID=A0A8K1ZZ68_9CYAN|nr:NAD(P)H-dependent oxidoreductase [Petrachloros mirabilis]NCJ06527.1 FMN-dependent NADH-azoreductase [Petrachloros mirabilis ULC683]
MAAPTLLHLDASARVHGSESRKLTATFVATWQQQHPQAQVMYRDLGQQPVPHLDDTWVAAYEAEPEARTPEMQAAIALSDQLIDELMAADRYVLGVPMYNLTLPATLKAYIDQVVRRDRILKFDPQGRPQGQLQGKKLLVITTRKFDYRPGSGREDRDFLEPYLRDIFTLLGIQDLTFLHADRLAATAPTPEQSLATVTTALDTLAQTW